MGLAYAQAAWQICSKLHHALKLRPRPSTRTAATWRVRFAAHLCACRLRDCCCRCHKHQDNYQLRKCHPCGALECSQPASQSCQQSLSHSTDLPRHDRFLMCKETNLRRSRCAFHTPGQKMTASTKRMLHARARTQRIEQRCSAGYAMQSKRQLTSHTFQHILLHSR